MTCSDFQQWLDADRPSLDAARMTLHAAACSDCDRALRAAIEIDRLLSIVVPAEAGAELNDAVMRTLHRQRIAAAILGVFAEPIVPIAIALISIIAWQFETIVIRVSHSEVPVGLAVAIAPVIFWISWRLFRTYERMT